MPACKPRFLRWIEEAEARRLRERAVLEPDASGPLAAVPFAAVPWMQILRPKPRPQTDRDGPTHESLSCTEQNSGD
jgi:hypothetical protein